jgi:hypothetical protein
MDNVSAVSDYVGKIPFSTGAGGSSGKMKVLLISETGPFSFPAATKLTLEGLLPARCTGPMPTAITQSALLSYEVYIIELVTGILTYRKIY